MQIRPGPPAGCPDDRLGLTLAQAEELLDWLEAHGCRGLGVCWLSDRRVRVWRARPSALPC
jgi:hypothetical protein